MLKKTCYIMRIVSILDLLFLLIFTIFSLIEGTNIDLLFIFRFLLCLIFPILLFKRGKSDVIETRECNNKKESWFYFLVFSGIVLSVVQNYMFYEEMVRERGSISCAIAALAAYTLFDSAYKYYIYKEE